MTDTRPAACMRMALVIVLRTISSGTCRLHPLSVTNPVPRVTGLSPASVRVGSPAFVLTITGTGFVPTSVGRVSGANQPTTYLSPTQVRITVPESALVKTGNVSISVQNPTPGGGGSNGLNLAVN